MAMADSNRDEIPFWYSKLIMPQLQYPHCEICPIVEQPSQQDLKFRIHEGDAWRITLRDNQALLGTAFITLKPHRESLDQLPPAEEEEFIVIRNRLIRAVGAAFTPDVVNLSCLMNFAFRPTDDPDFTPQPHVHYHFKPRYSSSRTVAGETFTDPEFASPLTQRRTQLVGPAVGGIVVARIKENF